MNKENFRLYDSLGFHFNVIFTNIKRLMEERLKEYNLTHLQFSILMNLHKNNVTTQKELLKYSYGDEASITRLVDRLEAKGYLNRVQSNEDKRKKMLTLTKEGKDLTEKLIICANEVNELLVKDLEKDESKELLNLLKKVHYSFDN